MYPIQKEHINELLNNMHNGDAKSADELYTLMYRPLYAHILSKVRNQQHAEDIVHNVFVILLKRIHHNLLFFNGFGYIYKIADRETNHFIKRQKDNLISDKEIEVVPNTQSSEEDFLIKIVYNSLSDEEKEYIRMKMQGYLLQEIADKFGVSLSTAKRRIADILYKLRGELK